MDNSWCALLTTIFLPQEQKDEDWLTPFKSAVNRDWDFTAIHVYKNSMDGVYEDLVILSLFHFSILVRS